MARPRFSGTSSVRRLLKFCPKGETEKWDILTRGVSGGCFSLTGPRGGWTGEKGIFDVTAEGP